MPIDLFVPASSHCGMHDSHAHPGCADAALFASPGARVLTFRLMARLAANNRRRENPVIRARRSVVGRDGRHLSASCKQGVAPMYPKKAWYVACTPDEIDDKPLGRKICGESIVFYRGAEGKVAALEDFCPHRGAPLSLGSVVEGKLVCGYHGLDDGLRRQDRRHARPARARFPADPRPIPSSSATASSGCGPAIRRRPIRPSCITSNGPRAPNGRTAAACIHVNCDYRLMIDNLMDLTHETYVHATSIGQKEIDETPTKTGDRGRRRSSPAATWKASWRRRSGAWRCAATTLPTTCRWTAGRSVASRRRATC